MVVSLAAVATTVTGWRTCQCLKLCFVYARALQSSEDLGVRYAGGGGVRLAETLPRLSGTLSIHG